MPEIRLKGKHLKTFLSMGSRTSVSSDDVLSLLRKLDAEITAGGKHSKACLPSTQYKTMVPRGKISPGVAKSIYDYMIRHGVSAEGVYKYDNE